MRGPVVEDGESGVFSLKCRLASTSDQCPGTPLRNPTAPTSGLGMSPPGFLTAPEWPIGLKGKRAERRKTGTTTEVLHISEAARATELRAFTIRLSL